MMMKNKMFLIVLIAFFFLMEGSFAQSTLGGFPPCSVCGKGRKVSKPNGVVVVPDADLVTCATYEQIGEEGFFDPLVCEFTDLFTGSCGCRKDRNVGLIVGVVLGSVALLVILALVYFIYFRNKKNQSNDADTTTTGSNVAATPVTTTVGASANQYTVGENIEMVNAQPVPTPGGQDMELDVLAPQGRLGVVIDNASDGTPVVSVVKEESVVAGMVQVGDKILAVDDENVQHMTANKVSALLGSKSNNLQRKLTIHRSSGTEV